MASPEHGEQSLDYKALLKREIEFDRAFFRITAEERATGVSVFGKRINSSLNEMQSSTPSPRIRISPKY
jgi:hypothetical protein